MAGNGIGRHSLLFEIGKRKILIDPGNQSNGMVKLCQPDIILLTHAHADHVGNLIEVYKKNPKVRIYATAPTKAIVEQVFGLSDQDQPHLVEECLDRIRAVPYQKEFHLGRNIYARLIPAGHILGSASIIITAPEGNFLITGDFAAQPRGVLAPFRLPDMNLRALITEGSLVGVSELPEPEAEKQRFFELIGRTIARERSVVVATEPYGVFNEFALLLSRWQDDAAPHRFQIFINQYLKNAFTSYLDHKEFSDLWLEGDPEAYTSAYLVMEPFGRKANFKEIGPFCYFAGPGSLRREFPRRVVGQILSAGGQLIVDGRFSKSSVQKRIGKRNLSADWSSRTALFHVFNHITGPELKSLILEVARPTYLMHGSPAKLKRFAAEEDFNGRVSVLGLREQIVL